VIAPAITRFSGASTGRALYDGRLDPEAALAEIAAAKAA
jgi:hypothetical protein